jgi:predicted DNA-binding transcriptional regulator AlpA
MTIDLMKTGNPNEQPLGRRLISANQGAMLTGVAVSTWWDWSRTIEDFPTPIRISSRCTRWDKSEIHAWLESRRAA